jgi:aspartyl-tRNA(Asn)/glutamyl-tRNA(Gln) amidotransferase subunit A
VTQHKPTRILATSPPVPSVADAGRALRDGSLTAEALLDLHLARIAAVDGTVRAFWLVTEPRARAAAQQADADLATGLDRGPLMGIPFAVKDTIDMAGEVTTCGAAYLADNRATTDAAMVARLCAAGAVPLGKVATYDMGTVGPSFDLPRPPACNPWHPSHITGGSSSGSAAAVAAGMVRLALGSDTAGSIRSPAAYCGVVGLKPTGGLLSTTGSYSLAPTLDTGGIIAASVPEAALALAALADRSAILPGSRDIAGDAPLRIAYARDWFASDPACPDTVVALIDEMASHLTLAGMPLHLVTLPDYPLMEAVGAVIIHDEGLALHRTTLRREGLAHGRESYISLAAGVALEPGDAAAARSLLGKLRDGINAALADADVILTVTTLSTAPPFAAFAKGSVWTPMRTLPFNVTGHPAISVPVGLVGGLPIGAQLIARHGAEAVLLHAAAALEANCDMGALLPRL